MTDIKTRLIALGLNSRQARAAALGVPVRSLEGYEYGRVKIPAHLEARVADLERARLTPDLVRLGIREFGRGWVTWREESRDGMAIRATDSAQAFKAIYPTPAEALRQLRIEALGAREAWRAGEAIVRVEVEQEHAERLNRASAKRRYPEIFAGQRIDLSSSAEYAYSALCDHFREFEVIYQGGHSLCDTFQHRDGSWVCAGARDADAIEFFVVSL